MSKDEDAMLTETIARHFPDARVDGTDIDLGFAGLSMRCWVKEVKEIGPHVTASLFFNLCGGALGGAPVFASISGYGESPVEAVVGGGCNWACAFGPVLRAGLAGEQHESVETFDVALDGQPFRLFVDGMDRAVFFGSAGDVHERTRRTRARLGGWPWLARVVVDSGRLPLLRPEGPTILSVFVASAQDGLTVEVKVNGVDWPGMEGAFADVGPEPPGAIAMLRELAVLVPAGAPASLTRTAVSRTLVGLDKESGDGDPRGAVSWPGWRRHGGILAPPLAGDAVAALEAAVGPLPSDYRHFITEIGSAGAGPGYGLLSPIGSRQLALAAGELSWHEGPVPTDGPRGVLALAHAGCAIMWFLVLRGPSAGEVWCDARASSGGVRRAAASFSAWYRDWLVSAVDDRSPWTSWDGRACATADVLSRALESEGQATHGTERPSLAGTVNAGGLSIASGGDRCFAAGAALDPCEVCVAVAAGLGLGQEVFAPGVAALEGHDDDDAGDGPAATRAALPPARSPGSRVGRWLRRLTGRDS